MDTIKALCSYNEDRKRALVTEEKAIMLAKQNVETKKHMFKAYWNETIKALIATK